MRKVIFVFAAIAAFISLFPAPAASGVLSAIFGHILEFGAEEPLSKVPLVMPTPNLAPLEPLWVPRESPAPLGISPIISEPVAGATTEGGASTAAGTSHFGTSDSSAGAKAEGGSSTGDGTSRTRVAVNRRLARKTRRRAQESHTGTHLAKTKRSSSALKPVVTS